MTRWGWLCCALLAGRLPAAEFWVAPSGVDTAAGTLAAPFATLTRARDAARLQRAKAPDEAITIWLRGGTYPLAATVRFEAADSGTAAAPLTVRAWRDERPVLRGGVALGGFEPAGGKLLRADVAAQGLRGVAFQQLFWNDRRLVLARYPNWDPREPFTSGWAYVDPQAPTEGTPFFPTAAGRRTLQTRPEDWRTWADPTSGRVCIFASHEWWNDLVPIASVDPAERRILVGKDCSYRISPHDRYYVEGLREELDAPGEWWLDAAAGTLYLWPPEPLAGATVWAPRLNNLLQIDGARHVTVQGLGLEVCDGTAVQLSNATQCRLVACQIRLVGTYWGSGVSLAGGTGNRISGCDLSDIGSHGISLGGGDLASRTPAGNVAENNHVARSGVFYKQGAGITVNGVGNVVRRNSIHDLPRFGIMAGGADHRIEGNHLWQLCEETTDTGAIYCGATDWRSTQGFVIRHNLIHDVIGRGRVNGEWRAPYFAWGIYLDWSASGTLTTGNVVLRAPRGGIMLHDGRDNRIENNLIADCGLQQVELSGWTVDHFFWQLGLSRNGWLQQFDSTVGQPNWQRADPPLRDPRTAALPDGRTMHHNSVRRNILLPRGAAKAILYRGVDPATNPSDRNLVWQEGQPPRTGLFAVQDVRGPNLLANGDFEEGPATGLPPGWTARRPLPESRAELVGTPVHQGTRAVRLRGVDSPLLEPRPAWERQVMLEGAAVRGAQPGAAYQAAVWLRAAAAETPVTVEALCYKGGAWDLRFTTQVQVGTAWQQAKVAFRLPAEDQPEYRPGLAETLYLRVILRRDEGELWVDGATLQAATLLDEWAAWQATGQDRNSLVADPRVVAAARDDYRLQPDSPAFGLGWEAIPFDQIGCYQDPERASWPLAIR
ncbi:MAG: right-handed parallel beta-helix repeat-containing protein [Fimbriimonadaceae bacterium]|nr:right-handed parallel beta-helix repeat-containing protein [Fimbriimonadaceae bacterium]